MLFRMTREQALQFGLLRCTCGCRLNNHFDTGKCSRCAACKAYKEVSVVGEIVPDVQPTKKR